MGVISKHNARPKAQSAIVLPAMSDRCLRMREMRAELWIARMQRSGTLLSAVPSFSKPRAGEPSGFIVTIHSSMLSLHNLGNGAKVSGPSEMDRRSL